MNQRLSGQRTELTAQDVAITILGSVIRIEGMLFGIVVISALYHLFGGGGGGGGGRSLNSMEAAVISYRVFFVEAPVLVSMLLIYVS